MPFIIAALLAALSFALAVPAPRVLARAQWPYSHPGLALSLWMAIAISGALSLIGVLLFFAYGTGIFAVKIVLGIISFLLFLWLVYSLVKELISLKKDRDRHRHLLFLLAEDDPNERNIVDYVTPLSYCLPGDQTPVSTLSEGLHANLDQDELGSTILHEESHIALSSNIYTPPFNAWRKITPFLTTSKLAYQQVDILTEILADKNAAKKYYPRTVAQALVNTANTSQNPIDQSAQPYVETAPTTARLKALLTQHKPFGFFAKAGIVLLGLALISVTAGSMIYLMAVSSQPKSKTPDQSQQEQAAPASKAPAPSPSTDTSITDIPTANPGAADVSGQNNSQGQDTSQQDNSQTQGTDQTGDGTQ